MSIEKTRSAQNGRYCHRIFALDGCGSPKRLTVSLLLILLLGLVTTVLIAAPGDSTGDIYQLTPSQHGGGGVSSGGPYSLTATIGQPDTSVSKTDGTRLRAGFWNPDDLNLLFKDSFEGVSP